jgi:YHS domain-containing protein
MVKDKVCGTLIDREDAYYSIFGGEVLYFCSENCKDQYDAGLEEFYQHLALAHGENRFWTI